MLFGVVYKFHCSLYQCSDDFQTLCLHELCLIEGSVSAALSNKFSASLIYFLIYPRENVLTK